MISDPNERVESDDILIQRTTKLSEPVEIDGELSPLIDTPDDDLDEALMETFPASDPLASGKWE